jgi:hypothetical protein
MIGRNPLWVAKQHGHSLLTLLRMYAAWTADSPETDAVARTTIDGAKPNSTSPNWGATATPVSNCSFHNAKEPRALLLRHSATY